MLAQSDIPAALELCAREPFASVIPAARLVVATQQGWQAAGGEAWGWFGDGGGQLKALAWAGANLIPIVPSNISEQNKAEAIKALAEKAKQWGPRCSAITVPTDLVLALWRELKTKWPEPREIRYHQPLFVLNRIVRSSDSNYQVKLTELSEWTMLLPAAQAMFTEEVGYSPARFGPDAYQQHLKTMITEQRSYCIIENNQVVFKADIAAVANGVALLQGVWVKPEYRGQGIAKSALVSVINDVQKRLAPALTLYVNQHNSKALNLYRSLGFQQVGEFATVLF